MYSAVNDSEEGAIQSFTIGHEGLLLGPLSTAVTGGSYPSHIQPLSSGEDLFITNVSHCSMPPATTSRTDLFAQPDSGTVRILHLDTDPTEFNEESSVTLALPSGAKPEQAVEGSSGEIYVVDSVRPLLSLLCVTQSHAALTQGTDVSWVFSKADNGSWTITDALVSASGSHPHRAAVNTHTPPLKSQPARLPSHAAQGRFVFTLHDDLTVTTHDLHADDPNEPVSTVSIMPSGVEGAVFEAGELLAPDVSDKFPGRFVYCSSMYVLLLLALINVLMRRYGRNSRTNPKGDIISILSVSDDGSLTYAPIVPSLSWRLTLPLP